MISDLNEAQARLHNMTVMAVADATQRDEVNISELAVRRACGNCFQDESEREKAMTDVRLLSPTGCVHTTGWDSNGDTACGIDATGTGWWWAL